jgi:shikimate dehydrogenase
MQTRAQAARQPARGAPMPPDTPPSAAAAICAMIGAPVSKTALPGLFNRWAMETAQDAQMVPMEISPAALPAALTLLRAWENCRGAVLTAPHKQAAARLADRQDPHVARLGAANLLRRGTDGTLVAHNTDGAGFLAAARSHGLAPEGARALILGCGGAGAAIALTLAEAGAARIALHDPDSTRLDAALALAGQAGRAVAADAPLADFDLVVNATAIGSDGRAQVRPLDGIRPGTLVAELVSAPRRTPWLRDALSRGCRIQTGAEMAAAQLGPILAIVGLWPER